MAKGNDALPFVIDSPAYRLLLRYALNVGISLELAYERLQIKAR